MEEFTTYRVYNKCKYMIGIKDAQNQSVTISPGDFAILNARDIVHAENLCTEDKYFAKKMLVPYDEDDNEVSIAHIGKGRLKEDSHPHITDEEIETILKGNIKKMEQFLKDVNDPAEVFHIVEMAKSMDLTAGKLKVLAAKCPSADLLSQYE